METLTLINCHVTQVRLRSIDGRPRMEVTLHAELASTVDLLELARTVGGPGVTISLSSAQLALPGLDMEQVKEVHVDPISAIDGANPTGRARRSRRAATTAQEPAGAQ